jgi:hypothetical protein
MHKGVILLVKTSQRDEAYDKIQEFLVQHGDGDVWDWYVIGGRWSGTLNPKTKEFFEKVDAHFKATYPENNHNFVSTKMVEEQSKALEMIWNELEGVGIQPYARSSYNDLGSDDDVVPLSECTEVVTEWEKDLNVEAEKWWAKMVEAKSNTEQNGTYDMSGYYAKLYAESKYDEFCFESNVYDIENETNNPAKALNEADQYFAVMIDMHN